MGEVAFLFSGGVDSTAGTLQLLETFERVHLLTFDIGHGVVFPEWSRRSASRLLERFPGRVTHQVEPARADMDRLVRGRLVALRRTYGSRFVWCLSCKAAMHAATIRWCRAHGLADAADGSSRDTPYYVEQMPVSLAWFRAFYEKHGIRFHHPVHAFASRAEEIRLIDGAGLARGRTLLGRNPGTQPFCVAGNFVYAGSTLLKAHPAFDPDRVRRFLEDHESVLDGIATG